jgi:transcriptional antiterminator RfaH
MEILQTSDARWTAVHTRPRCEKLLARYCDVKGLACYLPLRRRVERYQRRNVETYLPMFPGYVFVHLSEEEKPVLLQSNRVASVLSVDEAAERVLIEELRAIQRLEQLSQAEELVVAPELVAGKAVLITDGPLNGVRGIVMRRPNKTRVTVNVEILGQSVSVDLDVGEVCTDED